MRIDVWSDVVCPWCYIGKRRLEAAIRELPPRAEVEVVWHSFELDPAAPRRTEGRLAERLAAKYGMSVADAEANQARLTGLAAAEGLRFDFDRAQSGSTFDAHRLVHLGLERGVQDAVKERLMRGYFTEGAAVGEPETLVAVAVEAGLDEAEVREVLSGDSYAGAVRQDEEQARRLGISGVPFFVIDGRYGVSGAQPSEALLEVMTTAWDEAHPVPVLVGGPGEVCEGDACVV